MAIDRRGFLKSSAAQAALLGAAVTTGAPGCAKHPGAASIPRGVNPFRHGVASGDPLADRVILWTRVSPFEDRVGEPIETHWWIARDALGLEVVAGGTVEARAVRDYTVKIDASGLEAGTDYAFGFMTQTGLSTVGRTRTLPKDDVDRIRMGVTSCANYPNGFFNAYACLAARSDLDVVLHLGDYLYEYGNGEYGDGTALGRLPDPSHEILTLEDYRRRHATYKRDPDLQAAHARHPWITIWDDHESANNSSPVGAENHDPETEGDWTQRKLAAIRAYYEWMPIRELPTGIFRSFAFGDLADLIMLDTRLHGRDPETEQSNNAAADDPARTLLGADQRAWFFDALSESKSRAHWRVIGQQIMVAPVSFNGTDFNPDSWNGYRADRDRVLDYLASEAIDNVVFLTGDVHSAWVFDVPPPRGRAQGRGQGRAEGGEQERGLDYDPATGAGSRAVEFVCPAVSSPPLASRGDWSERAAAIESRTPHLRYMNLEEQGFVILDLTRERARAEFYFTDSAQTKSARAERAAVFETRSGTNHAVRVPEAGERG